MTTDHAPSRSPRLNPFAFPSETDARFILLVLAVIGSALFIFRWLLGMLPGAREALLERVERCAPLTEGIGLNVLDPLSLPNQQRTDAVMAAAQAGRECWAGYNFHFGIWSLAGVAVLFALSFAIYWLLPWWKIRQSDLEPLDSEDTPDLMAHLQELSQEAGLTEPPTFLVAAARPTASGLAFGRVGRRFVEMDGGLVLLYYMDPAAFRAVILHELAHLRNGDVDKAYGAIAICLSFILLGVLPFAVSLIVGGDPIAVLHMGIRGLGLAALVLALGTATLRAREIYADVRASVWDGPEGALRRLLGEMGEARVPLWRTPLQFHPPSDDRRRAVDDTRPLFGVGFWDAFLTGAAATVAFDNVATVIWWLTTAMNQSFLGTSVAGLLYAPLMTGVIGLGIWRMSFAAAVRGDAQVDLRGPSLGLALGLATGQLLSFTSSIDATALSPVRLVWIATLVAGVYLWLRWVQASAGTWLDPLVRAKSPRPVYWTALGIASIVLTFWFALMYQLDSFLAALSAAGMAGPLLFFPMLLATAWLLLFTQPLVILMLVSLWALPLASAVFARDEERGVMAEWVYLDPGPDRPRAPDGSRFHFGFALWAGIGGGLLYDLALLGIRIARRTTIPADVLDTDAEKLAFAFWTIALAVGAQVIVASVVAARVRPLGFVHGLFAGFVAGCVMFAGFIALNLAFGGTADAEFLWNMFRMIVNVGTLITIPVAAVAAFIGGRLGGPRRSEAPVTATG